VSQLETRPCEIVAERGGRSALAATRPSLVESLLQIGDRRVDLLLRPVLPDRRHLPDAGADDIRKAFVVGEQWVRGDVRPDPALRGQAVALRADADERLLAERGAVALSLLAPGVVLVRRHHLDPREHRRVLDAAELGALAREGAELRRAEARVVDLSGDRVELAAERRHPPAVRDVVALDLQSHRPVLRQAGAGER